MEDESREISKEEVEHIAWLAKIELSEEEKKRFTEQLNTILDYFQVIDEVDTEGVTPTCHVVDLSNVLRDDVVEPSLPRSQALRNVPKTERGYVKAPKIV